MSSIIKRIPENSIKRISYEIISKSLMQSITVINGEGIKSADWFDNVDGGISDLRLGAINEGDVCKTCGLNNKKCDGHFGHIKLEEPMVNMAYYDTIVKILKCICIKCSKLLLSKEEIDELKNLRTNSIKAKIGVISKKAQTKKNCQAQCNEPVATKIECVIEKKNGTINYRAIYKQVKKKGSVTTSVDDEFNNEEKVIERQLSQIQIYSIISNISELDCQLLGFIKNIRPNMLMFDLFPVPPLNIRPSIYDPSVGTRHDDLSKKLASIIKNNIALKNKNRSGKENNFMARNTLQEAIAMYYNEGLVAPAANITSKSLVERFNGKKGIMRLNLQGKRVDYSGRTVISPDPTIATNEISVPLKMAMNLTYNEIVTIENIERMKILINNGDEIYPGAKRYIDKDTGKFIHPSINFQRRVRRELKVGDTVQRHLQDGDIIYVNRQPTLHKQSMMGHFVKVRRDPNILTLGLPVSATNSYNADYDGDEMNVHVPQSIGSQCELIFLANVQHQLMSHTDTEMVLGVIEDGLIGSYIMCENITFNWREAMNMAACLKINNIDLVKNKKYTSKDLLSILFTDTKFSYKSIDDGKVDLHIENGKFIDGKIGKKHIGIGGSLLKELWYNHSRQATIDFIDNIQKITNIFNIYEGITVSISDFSLDQKALDEVDIYKKTIMTQTNAKVTNIENNTKYLTSDIVDKILLSALDNVRTHTVNIISNSISATNNIKRMVDSGAKAKYDNVGQMLGCLGVQAFKGAIIQKTMNGRSNAFAFVGDDRPESRGFISNSFYRGMTFNNILFHAFVGRDGLIVQALKTADSGAESRKLIKFMENCVIKYDNTVRISNNKIVQMTYCGMGNDASKCIKFKYRMLKEGINLENLKDTYFEKSDPTTFDKILMFQSKLFINITRSKLDYGGRIKSYECYLPVDIFGAIKKFTSNHPNTKSKHEQIPNIYITNRLENVVDVFTTYLIQMIKKKSNSYLFKFRDNDEIKFSLLAALYDTFAPKRVNNEYKYDKKIFDCIIDDIIEQFNDNIMEPGEMVGFLASQSFGERVTQTTLDTFHSAGITSETKSASGIDRIKELFSCSKNTKFPHMNIFLMNTVSHDKNAVKFISSNIKYTILDHIYDEIKCNYDPHGKMNDELIFNNYGDVVSFANIPWVYRLVLNKESILNNSILPIDINKIFLKMADNLQMANRKSMTNQEKTIYNVIENVYYGINNIHNTNVPLLHIRIAFKNSVVIDKKILDDVIDYFINPIQVKGIIGATASYVNNIIEINESNGKKMYNKVDLVNGELLYSNEYTIITEGVNLIDIRKFKHIDLNRTVTDDIYTAFIVFGIEIARQLLLVALSEAYSNAGSNVNYEHIELLVDIMTCNGVLTPANGNGALLLASESMSCASFEKPIQIFTDAALNNKCDGLNDVSSKITFGQGIAGGTNMCDVSYNFSMLREYSNKVKKNINTESLGSEILKSKIDMKGFVPIIDF